MDEKAFKETLINVLKYDNKYIEKANILVILNRSQINSLPQYEFAKRGRSNQRWENIEIRVPVPLINNANSLYNDINELIRYVYEETDDYALHNVYIKPLIQNNTEEVKEHNAIFGKIKDTVIQGIRDAKYSIWIAMAWFTNDEIFRELLVKKKNGISIRVVLSDESKNQTIIEKLKDNNFDLKVIPNWNTYNRMHEKFCIIDLEYVMHGTYNWTYPANSNDETLATALDREFTSKFADEFIYLYNK